MTNTLLTPELFSVIAKKSIEKTDKAIVSMRERVKRDFANDGETYKPVLNKFTISIKNLTDD